MWDTVWKISKYLTTNGQVKYRVFEGYVTFFGNHSYYDSPFSPLNVFDTEQEACDFIKSRASFRPDFWEFDKYGKEIVPEY